MVEQSPPTPLQGKTYYTCDDSGLRTWWHDSGVINTSSRIDNAAVRKSRRYTVQVSKVSASTDFCRSFVYETIPRNGNGRIYSPWDDPGSDTLDRVPAGKGPEKLDDGVSIEIEQGINMAWTQFEYGEDVTIKIFRTDGPSLQSFGDVTIRPKSISYSVSLSVDGSLEIVVPMDPNGRRFSVEFEDDLYTYRSNKTQYVNEGGVVVGKEPRNALLIFASPFLPDNMKPDISGDHVHTMTPGPINQNCWGSSPVLYFPPGVYWMNSNPQDVRPKLGENHIILDPKTYWVHFAPGAYVKGAIEYTTQEDFFATGHGVLSGEHYVYQANPETFYQASKSDFKSLRMWGHYNLNNDRRQKWACVGMTINSPPFNTMDFYNRDPAKGLSSVSVEISDYKQVGAFYMQTDGPQVYPNSTVHDVFYHANDDAIKTYYSNVTITRAIIWKVFNDPVIQMGWDSRQVDNVTIDGLDIIHTRYQRSAMDVPSAIIGASPFYLDRRQVDTNKSISMDIRNVTCEGPSPALLRITPLQSYDLRISNVSFPDGLQTHSLGIGQSEILKPDLDEPHKLQMKLNISNWTIGKGVDKTKVTMDNFRADQLGQLSINEVYWGQWNIA